MQLFSRKKQQIAPAWSYHTDGVLWRVMFSETGLILGEDRNIEKRSVKFFCLEAKSGKILWKDRSFDEQWWISIEQLIGDRAYLHGFRKPDLPEHSGITALDLRTGNEIWRNPDVVLHGATESSVTAFKDLFERRVLYSLDWTSGILLQELRIDSGLLSQAPSGRTDFEYPRPLIETEEDYPRLIRIISAQCRINEIRGPIEYVRSCGKLIFNVHRVLEAGTSGSPEVLENIFCILDETTGAMLFQECLNTSTPAIAPDSFFADKSTIYYLKERNSISALNVLSV